MYLVYGWHPVLTGGFADIKAFSNAGAVPLLSVLPWQNSTDDGLRPTFAALTLLIHSWSYSFQETSFHFNWSTP
jgi:hypothetical protein